MAVFCSSLMSCFPGMLLRYFVITTTPATTAAEVHKVAGFYMSVDSLLSV
jgi:hypothetical protein